MKQFLLLAALAAASLHSNAQSIDSALVACYPFSGNPNDATGNGHNGTAYGATLTTDRNGIANSAYAFNGTSDYIEAPNFGGAVSTTEFTITFWALANAIESQAVAYLYPDDAYNRMMVSPYFLHSAGPSMFWDFGSIYQPGRLYDNNSPATGQWHHFVCVSSISGGFMNYYQDGVLAYTSTQPGTLTTVANRSLRIGGGPAWDGTNFHFDGKIDDIRIYNRALSASEAMTLYTTSPGCQPSAINEQANELNFSLYPNPATGSDLMLEAGHIDNTATIIIVSSIGQVIYSNTVKAAAGTINERIPVSQVAAGVYTVRVSSGNYIANKKLVIQ